jgi:hypothetical protein
MTPVNTPMIVSAFPRNETRESFDQTTDNFQLTVSPARSSYELRYPSSRSETLDRFAAAA